MLDFTAIDFETANSFRGSPCSVGLARVRDGEIVKTEHWLMRPPAGVDHFDFFNTQLHGISANDVTDKPRFDEILEDILDFIGDDSLIAHNAAFDTGVLRYACDWTGITLPVIREIYCTLVLSRHGLSLPSYQLPAVASHFGIQFANHHTADADAAAAAQIAIALAHHRQVDDLYSLARELRVIPGYMSPDGWSGTHRSSGGGPRRDLQVVPANIDADPDGYLFGRSIVFTGALPGGMTRQEAFDAAAQIGAVVEKGVTKRTNVLVVGDLSPARLVRGQELSGKARKVADLQAKGQDIEVLTGDEFLRLIPGLIPTNQSSAGSRNARRDPLPLHRPGKPTVQQCSEDDCTNTALFGTRTRPTWCDSHMTVLLSRLGLMPMEPFVSRDSYRLCQCVFCGFEGHYKLDWLLGRLEMGAQGCQACNWRSWAAECRSNWPDELALAVEDDTASISKLSDQHGFDYLGPLTDPIQWGDPHRLKCRACGKISAMRVQDIGFGCTCVR